MTQELHRNAFPGVAASNINAGAVVKQAPGNVERQFIAIASGAAVEEPFGIALASALQGEGITILELGSLVKVTAGASLGAGADIGIGSTNGALAPIAGASGVTSWCVGKSHTAAAAGEKFALYVHPRQLANQA